MFRKQKIVVTRNEGLLENIKMDIENRLKEKGVMISGVNMKMNLENITLSIQIRCLPPKIQQHL